MIASFLISQQNHITRIRKCIQNLCETYGEERTGDSGNTFYTFPEPEKLAELGDDDLKACNLGYRSKYVVRTAKSIVSGEVDLDAIQHLPYAKAKKELLSCLESVRSCRLYLSVCASSSAGISDRYTHQSGTSEAL